MMMFQRLFQNIIMKVLFAFGNSLWILSWIYYLFFWKANIISLPKVNLNSLACFNKQYCQRDYLCPRPKCWFGRIWSPTRGTAPWIRTLCSYCRKYVNTSTAISSSTALLLCPRLKTINKSFFVPHHQLEDFLAFIMRFQD